MIWVSTFMMVWVVVNGQKGVPPVGSEYNDKSQDGSYRFGFQTGDAGNHYHTAVATKDNDVIGRFGSRDPAKGQVVETQYTAGRRGFRPRGPNVARKYDLSQNKIPYNPPVSPNSPNYNPTLDGYHDPNEDPSFSYQFRTPKISKTETADSRGHVNGLYSFLDDAGERHDVSYEAGAKIGFNVKTPFPDSKVFTGSFFRGLPSKPGSKTVRGKTSIQQRNDGSYRFVSAGPDQRRTEVSDASGHRRGSYTYIDDKGQQRTVEYIAGPNIGYRIISKGLGVKFPTAAPFIPPRYPDFPSGFDPSFPTDLPAFPVDAGGGGSSSVGSTTSSPGLNNGGSTPSTSPNSVDGDDDFNYDLFGGGGSAGQKPGGDSSGGNNFGGGGGGGGGSDFDSGNFNPGSGGTGDQGGYGNKKPGFGGGSGNNQGGFGSSQGGNDGGSSGGFGGGAGGFGSGGFGSGGSGGGGFGSGGNGGGGGFNGGGGFGNGGYGSPGFGSGSPNSGGGGGSDFGTNYGSTSERPTSTSQSGFFNGFSSTSGSNGPQTTRPTTSRYPSFGQDGFQTSTPPPGPFSGYPDGRPPAGSPTLTSFRPTYVPPTAGPPPSYNPLVSAFPEDDPSRPLPNRPSLEDDFLQSSFKDLPKKFYNHPSYYKPKPPSGQRNDGPIRDDSTFLSSNKRFYSYTPGVAVRAHVQSVDIRSSSSRIPPPGFALEHSLTHQHGK